MLLFAATTPVVLHANARARARTFACARGGMAPSRPARRSAHATVDVRAAVLAAGAAAAAGVRAVRAVHELRVSSPDALRAAQKDPDDPRSALTLADTRAQAAVLRVLRESVPGVAVVAEEEESGDDAREAETWVSEVLCVEEGEFVHVPADAELGAVEALAEVDPRDMCFFVDPVDGTLEFVKAERLDAVQTLVGVSYRGRAVGAAVGLPFFPGGPRVVLALVGAGVVGLPEGAERPEGSTEKAVLTASKNPKDDIVGAAERVVDAPFALRKGGAGNKILTVAVGDADVSVLNRISQLWDTCAPEAIISSLGGRITDLCGNPIQHTPDGRLGNIYGVVITSAKFPERDARGRTHKDLVRELRAAGVAVPALAPWPVSLVPTQDGQVQAADVARDVRGNPLTAEWLGEVLGATVESYAAPEESAVRYLMSDAVRISLKYEDGATIGKDGRSLPGSLFYKRIVLRELEHIALKARSAPQKIVRDVTSYQVESAFLGSSACKRFCDAGAKIPRAYHVVSEPAPEGDSPVESRFALLMEDFNSAEGWAQRGLLEGSSLCAALAGLADMHAFFWACSGDSDYAELQDAVWDRATYWIPERQVSNLCDLIEPEWRKHHAAFGDDLARAGVAAIGDVTLDNLGERLAAIVPPISERVHAIGAEESHPQRTVIHGDSKAGNFFFKETPEAEGGCETGMIDFQWSGFGHPIVDVAYTIASSAAMSELSADGVAERGHVEYYLACLQSGLLRHGKVTSPKEAERALPLEDALSMYDDCMLDLAKLVFGYHWARIKASPDVLASRVDMLGSNSYNKSVPHAVWLISRTLSLVAAQSSRGV